jgi:hypothetical protein
MLFPSTERHGLSHCTETWKINELVHQKMHCEGAALQDYDVLQQRDLGEASKVSSV